jgi:hypothetical protein
MKTIIGGLFLCVLAISQQLLAISSGDVGSNFFSDRIHFTDDVVLFGTFDSLGDIGTAETRLTVEAGLFKKSDVDPPTKTNDFNLVFTGTAGLSHADGITTVKLCDGTLYLRGDDQGPGIAVAGADVMTIMYNEETGALSASGFVGLAEDVALYSQDGFCVELSAGDSGCGAAGLTLTTPFACSLSAGLKMTIPEGVMVNGATNASLSASSCSTLSWARGATPALSVASLDFGVSSVRLGGSLGLLVSEASLCVDGIENAFEPTQAAPFSIELGGKVQLPNSGPSLEMDALTFTVADRLAAPAFSFQELAYASGDGPIMNLLTGALPVNLTEFSIGTKNSDVASFSELFAPSNLYVGISGELNIPPESPIITGSVEDLQLSLDEAGLPQVSVDELGFGISGVKIPPLTVGGQVYIGGLSGITQANELSELDMDNLYFVGNVEGSVSTTGFTGLLAFDIEGPIGLCLGLTTGAGIPLGPTGFLLTGGKGGVNFQNGFADPCEFASYITTSSRRAPGIVDEDGNVLTTDGKLTNPYVPNPWLEALPATRTTWSDLQKLNERTDTLNELSALEESTSRSLTGTATTSRNGASRGDTCPPETLNPLCEFHPDADDEASEYAGRVIYKFTSIDASTADTIIDAVCDSLTIDIDNSGLTSENVTAFVGTLVDQTITDITDELFSLVPDIPEDVEPLASLQDELEAEINDLLDSIRYQLVYRLEKAINDDVFQGESTVRDAIKKVAYGGIPALDATVSLTGYVSFVGLSAVLNVDAGVIVSSTGTSGVTGHFNLLGVPVGDAELYCSGTDENGDFNPSMCGTCEVGLGPLEFGEMHMSAKWPNLLANLLVNFAVFGAELVEYQAEAVREILTNLKMKNAAGETVDFSSLSTEDLKAFVTTLTPQQQLGFLAELLAHNPWDVDGAYNCLVNFLENSLDGIAFTLEYGGTLEPKLFGFSMGKDLETTFSLQRITGDDGLSGDAITLESQFEFSPTKMLTKALPVSNMFPAADYAQFSYSFAVPNVDRFLIDAMRGTFATPDAFLEQGKKSFTYMLGNAVYGMSYQFNPFGLQLFKTANRILMPDLTSHPAFQEPAWQLPETTYAGLPSRSQVLIAALRDGKLGNALWKGTTSDIQTLFADTDYAAALVAHPHSLGVSSEGASDADSYFPHGGIMGASELYLPKIITDSPPVSEISGFFSGVGDIDDLDDLGARFDQVKQFLDDYVVIPAPEEGDADPANRVGYLAYYMPAPNPPADANTLTDPQALLERICDFDPDSQLLDLYPDVWFVEGEMTSKLFGVELGQASIQAKAAEGDLPARFEICAHLGAESWMQDFTPADAELKFLLTQAPPDNIQGYFKDVITALGTVPSDAAGARAQLNSVLADLNSHLPKLSLEATLDLQLPNELSQIVKLESGNGLYVFSPQFEPDYELGVIDPDPYVLARRHGGIAAKGHFTFGFFTGDEATAIKIDVPEAAIGISPSAIGFPALSANLEVDTFNVPGGIDISNGKLIFNSLPDSVGDAYLLVQGDISPIDNALFNIEPALAEETMLSGRLAIRRSAGLTPDVALEIEPADFTLDLFENLALKLHGADEEDNFTFSTTDSWNASATLAGELDFTVAGTTLVQLSRVDGQEFTSAVSGEGLSSLEVALDNLPGSLQLTTFPDDSTNPLHMSLALGNSVNTSVQFDSAGNLNIKGYTANTLVFPGFEIAPRPDDTDGLYFELSVNAADQEFSFRIDPARLVLNDLIGESVIDIDGGTVDGQNTDTPFSISSISDWNATLRWKQAAVGSSLPNAPKLLSITPETGEYLAVGSLYGVGMSSFGFSASTQGAANCRLFDDENLNWTVALNASITLDSTSGFSIAAGNQTLDFGSGMNAFAIVGNTVISADADGFALSVGDYALTILGKSTPVLDGTFSLAVGDNGDFAADLQLGSDLYIIPSLFRIDSGETNRISGNVYDPAATELELNSVATLVGFDVNASFPGLKTCDVKSAFAISNTGGLSLVLKPDNVNFDMEWLEIGLGSLTVDLQAIDSFSVTLSDWNINLLGKQFAITDEVTVGTDGLANLDLLNGGIPLWSGGPELSFSSLPISWNPATGKIEVNLFENALLKEVPGFVSGTLKDGIALGRNLIDDLPILDHTGTFDYRFQTALSVNDVNLGSNLTARLYRHSATEPIVLAIDSSTTLAGIANASIQLLISSAGVVDLRLGGAVTIEGQETGIDLVFIPSQAHFRGNVTFLSHDVATLVIGKQSYLRLPDYLSISGGDYLYVTAGLPTMDFRTAITITTDCGIADLGEYPNYVSPPLETISIDGTGNLADARYPNQQNQTIALDNMADTVWINDGYDVTLYDGNYLNGDSHTVSSRTMLALAAVYRAQGDEQWFYTRAQEYCRLLNNVGFADRASSFRIDLSPDLCAYLYANGNYQGRCLRIEEDVADLGAGSYAMDDAVSSILLPDGVLAALYTETNWQSSSILNVGDASQEGAVVLMDETAPSLSTWDVNDQISSVRLREATPEASFSRSDYASETGKARLLEMFAPSICFNDETDSAWYPQTYGEEAVDFSTQSDQVTLYAFIHEHVDSEPSDQGEGQYVDLVYAYYLPKEGLLLPNLHWPTVRIRLKWSGSLLVTDSMLISTAVDAPQTGMTEFGWEWLDVDPTLATPTHPVLYAPKDSTGLFSSVEYSYTNYPAESAGCEPGLVWRPSRLELIDLVRDDVLAPGTAEADEVPRDWSAIAGSPLTQTAILKSGVASANTFTWRFYGGDHGAFGDNAAAYRTVEVAVGGSPAVVEPNPAEGYAFAGWSNEIPIQAPRGDRVFVAQYAPLPYQWTFDAGEAGTFRFAAQGDACLADQQEYTVYYGDCLDSSLELLTAPGWNWEDSWGNVFGQYGSKLYSVSQWCPLWVDENGRSPLEIVPGNRTFAPLKTTRHVYRYEFLVNPDSDSSHGVIIGPDGTEYRGDDAYVVEVAYEASIPLPEVRADDGFSFTGWQVPDLASSGSPDVYRQIQGSFISDPLTWEFYIDGSLCRSIGVPRETAVPEAVFDFDYSWTDLMTGKQLLGWDPPIPTASTGTDALQIFNAITVPLDYEWTFYADEHSHLLTEEGESVSQLTLHPEHGEEVTLPTIVSDVGYSSRWSSGSGTYTATSDRSLQVVSSALAKNWFFYSHTYSGALTEESWSRVLYIGDEVTAPIPEAKSGYRFTGWSPAVPTSMSQDEYEQKEFVAQFEFIYDDWTVTYQSGEHALFADGTSEKSYTLPYDTYPENPPEVMALDGWVWQDWQVVDALYGDVENPYVTMRALCYKRTYLWSFDIDWSMLGYGSTDRQYMSGDSMPEAPVVLPEPGWVFTGWTPDVPAETTYADLAFEPNFQAAGIHTLRPPVLPEDYRTLQCADIDGDGNDEILLRGEYSVTIWTFKDGAWTTLPDGPGLGDLAGWNAPEYYETLQCADLDGDGTAELVARAPWGLIAWKYDSGLYDNWWQQLSPVIPLTDENSWNVPSRYGMIRCGDLDGDGTDEVIARDADGLKAWHLSSDAATWEELASGPDFPDTLSWDDPAVAETFARRLQLANFTADGPLGYALLRPDGTLETGIYDADSDSWNEFSAPAAWTDAANYVPGTLQFADITGDGVAEMLRLAPEGLEAWSPTLSNGVVASWTKLPVNTALSAANGWDQAARKATIHCANLVGDAAREVWGVDSEGVVHVWQVGAETWSELAVGPTVFATAEAAGDPACYETIQTADFDGDGYAEIMACDGGLLWSWRLAQTSGDWTRTPVFGGAYLFSGTNYTGDVAHLDVGETTLNEAMSVASVIIVGPYSVAVSQDSSLTGKGFEIASSCADLGVAFGTEYTLGMRWFRVVESPLPPGAYRIVNDLTDCDLYAPSYSGDEPMEIDYTGDETPVDTFTVHQGDDGWMRIETINRKVVLSGASDTLCLDNDLGAANDRWKFERVRGGTFRIHNALDEDLLLAKNYGSASLMFTAEAHDLTYWRFEPVETNCQMQAVRTYSLKNTAFGEYLEVPDGSTVAGTRLSSSQTQRDFQQLCIYSNWDGQLILTPVAIDWDLNWDFQPLQPEMAFGAGPGGLTVELQAYQGTPEQYWYFHPLLNGSYYLENAGTGGILTISDAGGVLLSEAPSGNVEWAAQSYDSWFSMSDAFIQTIVDADPDDDIMDDWGVLATDDFDGDGFLNGVEAAEGTDPTSAASCPSGWMWTLQIENYDGSIGTFGMMQGATDDCDAGMDVATAETPPEDVAPYLYFPSDDLIYQRNIHAVAGQSVWLMEVIPIPDVPITLYWRVPSLFPAAGSVMLDEVDEQGEIVVDGLHANMVDETELTIPAGDVRYLLITYSGAAATVELPLFAGWNLVSLPFVPEPNAVESVFADPAVLTNADSGARGSDGTVCLGPVWRWDAEIQVYAKVEAMTALQGIWVYVAADVVLTISGLALEPECWNWTPHNGWNLLGPPVEMAVPDKPSRRGPCWSWDATSATYIDVDALKPKKGYWLNWDGPQTPIELAPQQ